MTITFKNVGQGDSIILEWLSEGRRCFGVIDCHRHNDRNPVLEHLVARSSDQIEFIFLTHPHSDHFSGMEELLDHCDQNNIQIGTLATTIRHDPRVIRSLRYANEDIEQGRRLISLFRKMKELYRSKRILNMGMAEVNWQLELGEGWHIRNLSPDEGMIEHYVMEVFEKEAAHSTKFGELANHLSSMLCLYNAQKDRILLTADSTIMALNNVRSRFSSLFQGSLHLAQIPHHGSEHNHLPDFWAGFKRIPNCPAAISAGENKRYNHPDASVVKAFREMGFQVLATNHVNGMLEAPQTESAKRISSALDLISQKVEPIGRDLVFEVDPTGVVTEIR